MPYGSAPYAIRQQVINRIPDITTDTTTTNVLDELMIQASEIMDNLTQRKFDQLAAFVWVFDGSGMPKLRVPDVVLVTQVRVRDNMTAAWRIVPAADIIIGPKPRSADQPGRWLKLSDTPTGSDSVFPASDQSVEVTGTWGWPSIPQPIQDATIELATAMFRSRGASTQDPISEFQPGIMPRAIPAMTYATAMRYRSAEAILV